jgi:hypothetical protein
VRHGSDASCSISETETVHVSLEAFIAAHRQDFEPVFLVTAYDQDAETPHIKAFLRRVGHALPHGPAGR